MSARLSLFENFMYLKRLQINRLFLSHQSAQARGFKDELFDLSQGIYHTFIVRLQIFIHHQAYPRIRHIKDRIAAFGGILKCPRETVTLGGGAALGFDGDFQIVDC